MPDDALPKGLRGLCWDAAFRAFATAAIFERRSARYSRNLRVLSFVGFGVPLMIGGLVMTYGTASTSVSVAVVLPYAGALAVVQLVASGWSLVADWSRGLKESSERIWVNHELSKAFEALGRMPPNDSQEFQRRFDVLAAEEKVGERTDYQLHITEAEKRMGYRAASRHFQRACATCGKVARELKAVSDCPVCGEPRRWWLRKHTVPTAASQAKAPQPASETGQASQG